MAAPETPKKPETSQKSNPYLQLLGAKATQESLGAHGNLFKIRPHLHHLDLPGETYRYPKPYTEAVGNLIEPGKNQGRSRMAGFFAGSALATRHIILQEWYFDKRITALSTDGWIKRKDVAELYNLSASTVSKWTTNGELEEAKYELDPAINLPVLYLSEDELRAKCQWIRPIESPIYTGTKE